MSPSVEREWGSWVGGWLGELAYANRRRGVSGGGAMHGNTNSCRLDRHGGSEAGEGQGKEWGDLWQGV